MSSKRDDDDEYAGKRGGKYDDDDIIESKGTGDDAVPPPKIEVLEIEIEPSTGPLSGPFELKIKFELDRDVIAGHWVVRFLVDSSDRRLIRVRFLRLFKSHAARCAFIHSSRCSSLLRRKVLGETPADDYPEGDNEMYFSADRIDVSGIAPSTLANSGLLMAALVAEGEEVASINMVGKLAR